MRISDWSSDVCSSDLVAVNPKIRFCNECIELRCIGSRDEIAAIPVVDRLQRRRHVGNHNGAPGKGNCEPLLQPPRSDEHTSELQSLMRTSYAVFCLKKKTIQTPI